MKTVKWKNGAMLDLLDGKDMQNATTLALLDDKDMQNEGFVSEALDYLCNKVEEVNARNLEEWGCDCRKVTLGKGYIVEDTLRRIGNGSQPKVEGLFLTGGLRFGEVLHILPEEDKWLLECVQSGIESWSFKGKPEMVADKVYAWYLEDVIPFVGKNTLKPAKPGDAGVDLKAMNACDVYPYGMKDMLPDVGLSELELQAKSNNVTIVHTELYVAIPEGHMGIIVPRSGVALKHGIQVVNTPGIIDSGYRGEIMIGLVNHGNELYHINKGDRVAQLIIVPFRTPSFIGVDTLGETERGVGGFGSTGIK